MKVELIDSSGGDLSVVNSARVSFDKESDYEVVNAVGQERSYYLADRDIKLVNYLAKHRHDTPFRHNFVQLRCQVPLFLARQLMKHQAGLTWNEESRRYVDHLPEFHYPEEWRARPEKSIKQGSAGIVECNDNLVSVYEDYIRKAEQLYTDLLELNVAPEMARMVLPQSMMVNFIWSGNLLAFYHVYSLRSGHGAQQEAVDFANLLKKAIEPEFPVSWKALEGR